jgi:hypothetical protein
MRIGVAIAIAGLLVGAARADSLALRLPRSPYMGLACDSATVLHCNRVGLAVWVRQRASAVTAHLDGRTVRLSTKAGKGPYARGLFWQGFLRDPHAQAWADASRSIFVRVSVTMATGQLLTTRALVYVSEGYG